MAGDINRGVNPSNKYLNSRFNNQSVDNTLSNMMGLNLNTTKPSFCQDCGRKLERPFRPSHAPDECYCETHFNEKFASQTLCDGCNRPIPPGPYVSAGGKKYHEQCHSQDLNCAGCSQKLFGESMKACGKDWHTKCFKCNNCHQLITGAYKEVKGYPMCNKCFASESIQAPQRAQNEAQAQGLAQKKKEADDKNKALKEMTSNIQKGKIYCGECGKIMDALAIGFEWKGSVFHETCFKCAKCGSSLGSGNITDVDGRPHCVKCGGGKAKSPFCGECGKKLDGKYVEALDTYWHKDCFKCHRCKKPFQGGYAVVGEFPYCEKCASLV